MGQVDPVRAATLLNQLAALLGTVSEQWIEAEMEYNRMFEAKSKHYDKITEAKVVAKASKEYENKLKSEALIEVTKELINSMKYIIKVGLEEQKQSGFQEG